MEITFRLNGAIQRTDANPTLTLLDYLRENQGLKGTKEGCNEGDCGACSVMVSTDDGTRALNACILFLPQLHGKSVTTIEGLSPHGAGENARHPVQTAMIEEHGSQCGFCTPGIVMSLVAAQSQGETDHETTLAGNLCRCTGYAPILRAAKKAAELPTPAVVHTEISTSSLAQRPETIAELAVLYRDNPDATLIAGGTDVGLWVTKQLRDLENVIFLDGVTEMRGIRETDHEITIGAMTPVDELIPVMRDHAPSLAEMLRRFSSKQIRGAATVGGNIANGSPIGDLPPPLIAAGARITLQRGDDVREILLEDFYISYGKQNRQSGELLTKITVPKLGLKNLQVYKISKRFDQDISAVCGAFNITVNAGKITQARIAFGGMAATPKRATLVENALINAPWDAASIAYASQHFPDDFQPISDMRASARYRMKVAKNLLMRAYLQDTETNPLSVLEVRP